MDLMGTSESTEEAARETEPRAAIEGRELPKHPAPLEYVKVAVALAIATGLEVAIYYTKIPHPLLVSVLLVAAFFKFSLVVLFFMHLRFDSPIFRRLFVTGLLLAIAVYTIVLLTFRVFIR